MHLPVLNSYQLKFRQNEKRQKVFFVRGTVKLSLCA